MARRSPTARPPRWRATRACFRPTWVGEGTRPMLEVRALTVHYGKALALESVDIDVPDHALMAVIGPNGAGKTTLLRAVSGLLRPSAGTVKFQGRPLNGHAPHRIVREGLVHC